ncbi:hypothetical protein MIND_01397900 [Mycena indigotica]|uniref:Uncharacterized protein n=1 Tax=Mycena indigotica TaxID=2126181 RepID=A0A8H6RYL2_9AGAR|nr:uncharacterized protein MIND_01397900 [Mycena indigotica]KAF7289356.1 hypothetical protein MIND_01397900 [Mycena indigotica]
MTKKAKIHSNSCSSLLTFSPIPKSLCEVSVLDIPAPIIHAVPPEICAQIAQCSTRQTVSRLSLSSHRLYYVFSPLLYENIGNLTSTQTARLLQTLNAGSCTWRTNPALFIAKLSLVEVPKENLKFDASQTALQNMHAASASRLRSLHWGITSGIDKLGAVISTENFPRLKELFVSCGDGGEVNTFSFMNKGGLEALGITLELDLESPKINHVTADRLLYKLAEAIRALPLTSPDLYTLQLHVQVHYPLDELPDALSDLVDALNSLKFRSLQSLDVCLKCIPVFDDDDYLCIDLTTFLNAHPQLTKLILNVPDTKLDKPAFISSLRSFSGSVVDATHLLQQKNIRLEELNVVHIHDSFYDPPLFLVPVFPSLSSLTKLSLSANNHGGNMLKPFNHVSPLSLQSIATSFPNLTHLSVPISDCMSAYKTCLWCLPRLQELRLCEYRVQDIPMGCPLAELFPSIMFVSEIRLLLGSLSELRLVAVTLLVDDGSMDDFCLECGCRSDVYVARMLDHEEMRVEYEFVVLRQEEVVMTFSEFVDKRVRRRPRTVPSHAE